MDIKNDIEFDIAFGKYRTDTHWKNKKLLWSEFLEKISKTQRTHETHAEYMGLPPSQQDKIKDVGGFVGGYIQGGRRLKNKIMHRTLLTLDIDHIKTNPFRSFKFIVNAAGAIYSTHKHAETMHRYRLIIPLDREVFPDEYQAIARRIAGDMGIDYFDDTTFQAERLMYWPSSPKDSPYVFGYHDAKILSADKILSRYVDWKDTSEWPISSRVNKVINREIEKQGDPLKKPGLIGTFNRMYSIPEAIQTFLQDHYEPTDKEDRYTYVHGSTAAGLVVYDKIFAYSHHGTDPTSMQLCNAFDLVRIHMFGIRDEDVKEERAITKMPSYGAMQDYITELPEIKLQLVADKHEKAVLDFGDIINTVDDSEPISTEWQKNLDVDKKGNFLATSTNVAQILLNDAHFKNNLAYDDFSHNVIAKRNLPWRGVDDQSRQLIDMDYDCIIAYIEDVYKFKCPESTLRIGGSVMSMKTRFHPIREWLLSLKWDKVSRIENVLTEYFGAEDSAYTRAVSRKFFAAGVTRVFLPGCKFDFMLTLIGAQGAGKSTFAHKIGKHWFSDSLYTVEGKDAYEGLQGVWIVEMAEMSAMRKSEVETVKHFISKQVDRFRVAFGKVVQPFPRQCIFIGSTNKLKFLLDTTGGRRFWPVVCGKPLKSIHEDLTDYEIEQLWAEAVISFQLGEKLFLPKDIEFEAKEKQHEHTEQDDRAGQIYEFLERKLPEDWEKMDWGDRREFLESDKEGTIIRQTVCGPEIWRDLFGGQVKDMNARNMQFIHDALRMAKGWKELTIKKRFGVYGLLKGYERMQTIQKKKLF